MYCEINDVLGKKTLTEITCRNWFERFRNGDFETEDKLREGRSLNLNEELQFRRN